MSNISDWIATFSAEVKSAMYGYAGRDCLQRRKVTEQVEHLYQSDFDGLPGTVDGMIKWLTAVRDKAPRAERATLSFRVRHENEYEGCSGDLLIWYNRLETDAEMRNRINGYLSYVTEGFANEHATYVRLKQKYDP